MCYTDAIREVYMKKFELAETESDREKLLEEAKKECAETGIPEEDAYYYAGLDEPERFGLDHDFPNLSMEKMKDVHDKLARRKELLKNYADLLRKIRSMEKTKNGLYASIMRKSAEICNIEGHRLSTKVKYDNKNGQKKIDPELYYRTCLICGRKIHAYECKPKDVVIIGETDLPILEERENKRGR